MGPACQKMIDESWLATDNELHIQATKDVPDGFVKQYLSDTKGALMFFCQQIRNGRQECQVKHCVALPFPQYVWSQGA